ncbi:MAG TPA: PDZ domain-containing protein [Flavobacterium sp.]|uniref:PDZ domain-containing protein n=1 Tax=Flavobacterium sp. TaxID=239 RepID=UPI002B4AEBBE|nr:PDZ domain-containing protein [Flavobacterium sp.]HLO72909.1 PDZ domain-containing protein [Flavobacterium sp.]
MRRIVQFSLMLFAITSVFAQTKWNSNKTKIKIPFELTHNLIIMNITLNNAPLNMILDTGSDRNLLFCFPEKDSLEIFNPRKVTFRGIGLGEPIEAIVSQKNNMKVKEYEDSNFEILIIDSQGVNIVNKLGVPINGIVGASFFKDFLVEIKYDTQEIILHKSKENVLSKKAKKYTSSNIQLIEDKPYIDLKLGIDDKLQNFKLLIDTGLGDGLWLFENDTIKTPKLFFDDVLGRGLGGDIFGKRSRVKKIEMVNYKIQDALVSFPDSISFPQHNLIKSRNGSLGGAITKRFNWLIDYENQKVYYKKNDFFNKPFNYNMSGIELQHSGLQWIKEEIKLNTSNNQLNLNELMLNDESKKYRYELKPVYEIYAIRKDSPAEKIGLKIGDRIVKINGKSSHILTIQSISDLFQSEDGKIITIVVERLGQQLTFKFKLEKLL